jgi:hypothetical protein
MKFFLFIAIVVSAWYVMQWFQQAEATRRRNVQQRSGKPIRAMDTIACKRCGTYVPSEFPTACDRRDCPFPGVG